MIQSRLLLLAVLMVVAHNGSLAQGTLQYLSNLDGPANDSLSVASDSWYAAHLNTGTNPGGYSLDSVSVSLAAISGAAQGLTMMLYDSDSRGLPNTILATLDGPDPSTAGVIAFSTVSQLVLLPSTEYFVALTANTPATDGFYNWNRAGTPDYESIEGWVMASSYRYSADGSEWIRERSAPFQFAIDATAVPEPSTVCLGLLGVATLCLGGYTRRRGRAANTRPEH